MSQKPKIQYVGQFYIHGSEARQLELQEKKKRAKSKLPLERLRKVEVVYLDPVAIFGIVTALVDAFEALSRSEKISCTYICFCSESYTCTTHLRFSFLLIWMMLIVHNRYAYKTSRSEYGSKGES